MACPNPFLDSSLYSNGGYIDGRLCQTLASTNGTIQCCLPCPMTDWTYPDTFVQVGIAAQWTSVFSMVCCVFLLVSWAALPIDKTHRHYLSICLVLAVIFMNLGFVIPLAGQPDQCYDAITPNDMQTNSVCAASGTFLILGGWAGVLWVFLRSLSLHLQICWQVVVGRNFMWFSQATGWGIPAIGIVLALTLSGVSFRFGTTCHINHDNSLADLWIPLLVFAGLTIIIQFATFGYCIKVYLASLADNNATTEGSGLPSYTNSIRTMTPRQAYRRVRRVIQLQWRGIAIVLIIIADVIFFAIVFVFEDNTEEMIKNNPATAETWISCLALSGGNKTACLSDAEEFVVNMPTIGAVLILLSINGLWLVLLLGRWSMVTGWLELITRRPVGGKREFVSVDALGGPYDLKMNTDPRSYEMLSRDKDGMLTPVLTVREGPVYPPLRNYLASTDATSPGGGADDVIMTPTAGYIGGRRTPDYFGQTARYQAPTRSFSSPRPPTREGQSSPASWEHAAPGFSNGGSPYSPPTTYNYHQSTNSQNDSINPLQMNRI
ncbi:hypothetical protein BD289DRAFT_358722 [Coniella lustricola]|uniref:G-protein coupled receptors family 2 profile 2 domain-containing protein n=1 Tax=Coniella lustricola TaxID=2025994 RepID=A0A2T3AMJ5_9PEZI|nr:hypothetical protein BD289DRAFT_358722 [Coniella lustricola]